MIDGIKGPHVSNACTCQCAVCGQGKVLEHDTCVTHTKVYKGVTKLWEDCVYPNGEFEGWHKLDCCEATSCPSTPSSMRWLYLKVHMLLVKEKMQAYF